MMGTYNDKKENKIDARKLKKYLAEQSNEYFEPHVQVIKDENGMEHEVFASDFKMDLLNLSPLDRVKANISLLEYNVAKLKAVDIDAANVEIHNPIIERIIELSKEQKLPSIN